MNFTIDTNHHSYREGYERGYSVGYAGSLAGMSPEEIFQYEAGLTAGDAQYLEDNPEPDDNDGWDDDDYDYNDYLPDVPVPGEDM